MLGRLTSQMQDEMEEKGAEGHRPKREEGPGMRNYFDSYASISSTHVKRERRRSTAAIATTASTTTDEARYTSVSPFPPLRPHLTLSQWSQDRFSSFPEQIGRFPHSLQGNFAPPPPPNRLHCNTVRPKPEGAKIENIPSLLFAWFSLKVPQINHQSKTLKIDFEFHGM